MATRNGTKTWINQIIRRVRRWWDIDPEFKSYMPDHQHKFRHPSPASQPDAMVPHQAFMKEFNIRYYERDFRAEHKAGRTPVMLYRQLAIQEPMRLKPGQTMGPFYGFDFDEKKTIAFHEKHNKQVYTYIRDKYPFKPEDRPRVDERRRLEEGALLYGEYLESQNKQQQQLSK